jgi:hypothetical protein
MKKPEERHPAKGIRIRDSKYLFIRPPLDWWESKEENYCARCKELIQFDFRFRSLPDMTPQDPRYWVPTSARCGCADSQNVQLRQVHLRRRSHKSDPRQAAFNFLP